ncbi:hypothetical protein OS493_035982 [Desmophyllum pertusum]|uniref:Secreted protein n=1 Tax=Desmophyllum pertusum TaxID=174260 RepID=A0A9X0CCA2_9CNID|nr:hypothetical protein OS493_035982 [Desmophyllum pertusum]
MKTTAVTSCILLLFISSQLFVDGVIIVNKAPKPTKFYRDDGISGSVPNINGKRAMEQHRDQEFRRNICLSARELDCEKELQA